MGAPRVELLTQTFQIIRVNDVKFSQQWILILFHKILFFFPLQNRNNSNNNNNNEEKSVPSSDSLKSLPQHTPLRFTKSLKANNNIYISTY